jgi:hypothetical protein
MLDHVAHPGALAQPPDEAARLAVGAAVLVQRWDQRDQLVVEGGQLVGRIVFELLQVEGQADDRAVAVGIRAAVHAGFEDAHPMFSFGICVAIVP